MTLGSTPWRGPLPPDGGQATSSTARPAATVSRPRSAPAVLRRDDGGRRPAAAAARRARSTKPGIADGGAGEDTRARPARRSPACGRSSASCARCRRAGARPPRAPRGRRRRARRRPRPPRAGRARPTCCSHWRACSSVRPRRSASVWTIASRPPAAARVNRQPLGVGDGDVDEAGDVDVEDGALDLACRPARGPCRRRRGRCPRAPGRPRGRRRRAARPSRGGRRRRPRACAGRPAVSTRAERLQVEDGLVHRHRDVVRAPASVTAAASAFSSSISGRSSVRTTMRWLAMPRRTRFGKLVLGEERLERLGQGGDVGDLAVAQDARAQSGDGAALERQRAVDGDLGGGDVAGVELEADDGGLGCGRFLLNTSGIGAERRRLR